MSASNTRSLQHNPTAAMVPPNDGDDPQDARGSELQPSESSAKPKPNVHPLDGGIWRPVAPHELIKRNVSHEDEQPQQHAAKVTPERRQHLERYLRDRPADIEAYLELAAIYRDMGRSVESKRVLKTALEIEPEHPKVLWELEEAELARSLQQLKDIREVAEKLVTLEAQRELERAKIDWANRRVGVCRARLQRDPQNHHLRVILAEALRELGENQEAIETLGPALECDAEAPQAYLILGQCQLSLGENLAAISAWRHAAMRREVPAPPKVRIQALRLAVHTAEALGLAASVRIYQQALQLAEQQST